jgi:hypothetical protein
MSINGMIRVSKSSNYEYSIDASEKDFIERENSRSCLSLPYFFKTDGDAEGTVTRNMAISGKSVLSPFYFHTKNELGSSDAGHLFLEEIKFQNLDDSKGNNEDFIIHRDPIFTL